MFPLMIDLYDKNIPIGMIAKVNIGKIISSDILKILSIPSISLLDES